MKYTYRFLSSGMLLVSLIFTSYQAVAGGLFLYEIGTDDLGLAAAGTAARAQDASVMASNPAGLSYVKGSSFTSGMQLLYGDSDYKVSATGEKVDDVIGSIPAISSFYSQTLDDNWTAGIGLYGNFGSGLDFGDWGGERVLKKADLKALVILPSVSYRINEQWSVGASIGFNYGILSLERQANSGYRDSDDTDWALNGKLGVLYEYSDDTRFGFGYTSKVDYNLSAENLFDSSSSPNTPIVSPDINAIVRSPAQVMFSAFHQMTADWAIMGNIGWQDWSHYSKSEINLTALDNNITTQSKNLLHDTYHLAFGAQHSLTPELLWNMGVAYDSSFYKDQDNTSLTMPSGEAVRLGTGFKYALDEQQAISVAFEYVYVDSSKVQGDPIIAGSYDTRLYFIMVNYSWRSL